MNINVKKIECKFALGDKAIMFCNAHTIVSVLITGVHVTEDYTEYNIYDKCRDSTYTVEQCYLFSNIEEIKNRLDKITNSGELTKNNKALVISE